MHLVVVAGGRPFLIASTDKFYQLQRISERSASGRNDFLDSQYILRDRQYAAAHFWTLEGNYAVSPAMLIYLKEARRRRCGK